MTVKGLCASLIRKAIRTLAHNLYAETLPSY